MKKGLNNVLIVLIIALFIIEIYNLALNIKYKSEIAKIIKIDNIKDFIKNPINISYKNLLRNLLYFFPCHY